MRKVAGPLAALTLLAAPAATGAPAGGAQSPRTVLDVGDSLSVGSAPYLRARLRGYRVRQIHDVGLHVDDVPTVLSRQASLPAILVVSAGTNDDPRSVSAFARSVRRALAAAGPRRCVVWPTIVRPPTAGRSYQRLNRALVQLARRYRTLVIVDWVGLVADRSGWLARDGVHVSAAGYLARAAAIAAAVRTRCEQ